MPGFAGAGRRLPTFPHVGSCRPMQANAPRPKKSQSGEVAMETSGCWAVSLPRLLSPSLLIIERDTASGYERHHPQARRPPECGTTGLGGNSILCLLYVCRVEAERDLGWHPWCWLCLLRGPAADGSASHHVLRDDLDPVAVRVEDKRHALHAAVRESLLPVDVVVLKALARSVQVVNGHA